MKDLLPVFIFFFFFTNLQAQKNKAPIAAPAVQKSNINKNDLKKLKLEEDTLQQLSNEFTDDTILDKRREACYTFIPTLIRALKSNYSFYYPFDSIDAISKVYPQDSSFRILSWQLYFTVPIKIPAKYSKTGKDTFFERPVIRYYGVIQMRSKEMKIFPLYDASDTLAYGTQDILSAATWPGELYYNVIQKSVGGKNYYTLFGYKAPDRLSRRKIIDVLTFDNKGKPHFGAPLFYFKHDDDSAAAKKTDTLNRFFIEYKWNAFPVLNYDAELEMIVFDHVAPQTEKGNGATFTYVPDGTYEGFKWMNNHWQWVEKVFTFAINEDDNPPVPAPLFGKPKKQPQLPKNGDER